MGMTCLYCFKTLLRADSRRYNRRTKAKRRFCTSALMVVLGCLFCELIPSDLMFDALKRQLAIASMHPYQVLTCHMCSSGSLLPELLSEPNENSFRAPDVAEPIRVFVLDHLADELRAAFAEPGKRIVDVLHGEHDT